MTVLVTSTLRSRSAITRAGSLAVLGAHADVHADEQRDLEEQLLQVADRDDEEVGVRAEVL